MKVIDVKIKEIYERTVKVEVPDDILLEECNDYITDEAYKQYQLFEGPVSNKEITFEFENAGDFYEYKKY